jgi:hypothetical protein
MADDDASSAEMRRRPTPPDADPLALDDETVERLLRGELPPAEAPPGYAEVAELLAAASAPPSPGELAGPPAILAELRAVTRPRRAASGRRRAASRRRAGLAAVVVVGALVTGGMAGAATGHLPGPVRDAARGILGPLGAGPSAAPPTRPGSPPGPGATGGPSAPGATTAPQGSRPATTAGGPASTAAGLDNKGRCQAYLAGKGGEQGDKLDASAFQALARAAGGEGRIAGYCAALLGQARPKDGKDDQAQPGDNDQGQGGPPASTGPDPGQGGRAPGAVPPGR